MANTESSFYIPALRFRWLTRFYDPILRAALKEEKFKRLLAEQTGIQSDHRVLDLGCGTATLTLMLKQAYRLRNAQSSARGKNKGIPIHARYDCSKECDCSFKLGYG